MSETTAIRTCPLCEAGCGLQITMRDGKVAGIRGDDDDVFSRGFICPKGTTLGALHDDPDRLRAPLVKRDGAFVEVSWDEAFAEVERRLLPIIAEHGRDAVALYLGNPAAHNLEALLFGKPLAKALGTKSIFTASTVDQRPKELSSALMFGGALTIPVPDIDRTDYLLMLGANPLESNGSLATAPDWPGRLKAIRDRGGKVVVVDPRFTRTADVADEHVAIRPGADAFLLAAMANVLFSEGLVSLGRLAELTDGMDDVRSLVQPFTPAAVEAATGIDAATIVRLARELAAAPTAVVYGRIGTTTQRFGTLASWLVDVLNVLTGNLDRPGGAMFARAAAGAANTRGSRGSGREVRIGRFRSRVRGLPETFGELPVATFAEEMDTPGEGRIRALVTVAGNPAVSNPDAARLDAALAGLDFMVSVDIYLNETTRHADVILPPPSVLERGHYDLALLQVAIRNVANWSPALLPLPDGQIPEWQILAKLALIAQGAGAAADPSIVDDIVIGTLVQQAVADPTSPFAGREPADVIAELEPRRGPERLLDFMLRNGPYDLTLADLEAAPHGIDLGALEPRLPEVLRTPSGNVELAPAPIAADVTRLRAALDEPPNGLVLIGRRHLRSNNSWLHNIPAMVKGKPRCTLLVHPDDAKARGLSDGGEAQVKSRSGALVATVEITEEIRPGVVSLPHGWGHDADGVRMSVASEHAGVNSNVLSDPMLVDELSGNAVLNGIPVEVAAV